MKALFVILTTLLAHTSAFAHEINFTLPENPVVVDVDLTLDPGKSTERVVAAPWFMANLHVENKSTHSISLNEMSWICVGGFALYKSDVALSATVAAGQTTQLSEYVASLPQADGHRYECAMTLRWTGPRHSHLQTFHIVTQ